jgi:uncharacterized iron-regulated membrane protein
MPELVKREAVAKYPLAQSEAVVKPTITLSQALAAMKTVYPDLTPREMASVQMPTGRYPYYIIFRRIKNDAGVIMTDPYSGRVHPMFMFTELWMGKATNFHTSLLIGIPGLLGNGLLSLFALFLLISGLWLWWPSNVRQLQLRITIRRGAPFNRWLRDVHNLMGIYLYAILFVTTLTAVLLVVNHATRGGLEKAVDKRAGATEAKADVVPSGQKMPVDRLVEIATASVPNVPIDGVRLPQKPTDAFQSRHLGGSGFLNNSIVSIDPYTGKVLDIEHDRTATPGHKTVALVQDLHFGYFGGVWSKILYTIAGFLPLGLFITGTLMWWRKKRAKVRNGQNQQTTAVSL